ncbi:alpha/beta hydrolase [Streptomyces albiaxialis]|uniref:Alpha/beta hydrolase n=1 Tax=Streptomyces albiaxialis TaxID=329523 RepID=A0ABN2VER1_9ACTN
MSARTTGPARRAGLTGAYAPPAPDRELVARSGDGIRFPVEVYGRDDAPAVVLTHGWTCNTHFWAPVIRDLTASGYRVVAYDQRGHGRSPAARTPKAYSTAMLADDLCAVLDAALEPGERAVIGGHSMGGMTIMAAADRPQLRERAAALLLCSTGAQHLTAEARVIPLRSARLRTAAHRLLLGAKAPLGPVTPLSRKALAYGTLGRRPRKETAEATARIVQACPTAVRAAWGGVLAELDVAVKVPRLDAPTAVIIGTHDRLTPVGHARQLAAMLPHCTGLHELPGRGHMTPLEEPGAVSAVLAELVRDHLAPVQKNAARSEKAEEIA